MSEAVAERPERVEAVIISGPRRGEIITLAGETEASWSENELTQLHSALQELDAELCLVIEQSKKLNRTLDAAIERL
jgi:hypothetical protein